MVLVWWAALGFVGGAVVMLGIALWLAHRLISGGGRE
jgi:hypothetical protein